MKPLKERVPLFLRRATGPVLLLAAVAGIVLLLNALGVPRTDPTGDKSYGRLAIGIASALVAVRLLDYFLFDVAFRLRREVTAPALLRQIVGLLVFGFCVALLFNLIFEVRLTGILATSAVLTVVIGLALQDTLGNLFSGLALHLEKTVQAGDMIRTGDLVGVVEELSWRAIKLRTMEGNILLIPNSLASREKLEVFPRDGQPIARTLRVGLEYETSPARAKEALEGAARNVPGVAAYPEPVAYLKKFDDYAISYELRYWLQDYKRYLELDSQVHERAWYRLGRENLHIAYPLVRQHQFAAGPLLRASRREKADAAIAGVDLFAPLSPGEREELAVAAQERRYAAGEVVVREGERGTSMFLVESGRLGVSIHGAAGDSRKLAVLEEGSAFGEISLLTGEPRTATVRALTESTLIEIGKETLAPILQANPSLVEMLDSVMRQRRQVAAELYDATKEEVAKRVDRAPLAGKIARFFGLKARGLKPL